ncbi:GNAT family N-acetyltransferase [Peristeroidobacter agariperforans]|uniref:GNAT family N-acetyltransferase n=1 Tax=Peristeroidobacter agariperforans TaxID=268404 RepID=UPI00101CB36E|nr:GNAT family N-acetyltransferase [Peristeroidobacter agariperforans]
MSNESESPEPSAPPLLLKSYSDVSPFVEKVIELADQNKDRLGFLPFSAYEELAIRGQLWIACEAARQRILGYLAFGGSGSSAKVHQLFVCEDSRKLGIGALLIDELKSYARRRNFQIVSARVAADLAANRFWERQGFYIVRQLPGGRTSGRVINVRVHELASASLWASDSDFETAHWMQVGPTSPIHAVPSYALDLNILFDLLRNRKNAEHARRLFATAFNGDVRLCVSHEFAQELKRSSVAQADDPILQFAESLPTLPLLEHADELMEALRSMIFPDRDENRARAVNDASDLRHLAACIRHGIRGFVTNEKAILRAGPKLYERYTLEVVSPFDLISVPAQSERSDEFPSCLAAERHLRTEKFSESDQAALLGLLAGAESGKSVFRQATDAGTSAKRRVRISVFYGDRFVAFGSWNEVLYPTNHLNAFLFVDEAIPDAQLIVDHLIGTMLSMLPMDQCTTCEIISLARQVLTHRTARALGFSAESWGGAEFVSMRKLAYRGVIGPVQWKRFRQDVGTLVGTSLPEVIPEYRESVSTGLILRRPGKQLHRTVDLFTFESLLAPLLLLAPNRSAFIVPIRDKLASVLLPSMKRQVPLFSKEAILHIERAYFGSSAAIRNLERGDLVVFYISGAEGGRAEAVGIARVTSTNAASPVKLELELLRQGVLDQDDLGHMARKDGSISYFTFDSFIRFPRAVPFRELKQLRCVGGANLVTTQPLLYDRLVALCEYAWAADNGRN